MLQEKTRFGYGQADKAFHVGEKPWYAVGSQLVDKAPTIEEALQLSGLDWEVNLKQLQTEDGFSTPFKGVVRSDNNYCLGTVSKDYTPLQNTAAFKFFEPFLESGQASLDCAGSFRNGRRVWIVAKINTDDMVFDESSNDIVQKYILLSNSHDGGSAVKVGYIPFRVCCLNSLTAVENSKQSQLIRIYHRKNVADAVVAVANMMDLIHQQFMTTEEKYRELMQIGVDENDLKNYVTHIFDRKAIQKQFEEETALPDHEVEEFRKKLEQEEVKEKQSKILVRVREYFDKEKNHNAWTAYNAVNSYLNHDKRSQTPETGLNALWFESTKNADRRALKLAPKIKELTPVK